MPGMELRIWIAVRKGSTWGVDLLIDLTDSGVDRIDMLKEQP